MKKLSIIGTPPNYFEWHKNIVSSKSTPRRTNLEAIHTAVEVRFNLYDTAATNGNLGAIAEDTALQTHRDDLQHCYNGKTKKRAEMLQCICDAQSPGALKWCPYCGLTGTGSYDHYLPKELFPEFSANPLNLVSSCTKCNSVKGDRWVESGDRLFIHFYSDQLPEEIFLFVNLHHNSGAFCASFRIEKPTNTATSTWTVIENHFRELKLLEKYRENANDEIVGVVNFCTAYLKTGGTNITAFLEELAKGDAEIFGENHWRIVLMRSLALNNDFANVVASKV